MTENGSLWPWLSSEGGSIKMRTREGITEVVASAHGLAACATVKDPSNASELRQCELEAIWQLKQLLGE
jgi:hypothetical protein